MERTTAKVFVSGRSQAVRIPKKFRFKTDEVFIEREGDNIILTPKPKSWGQYFAKGKRFSTDFPDNIEDLMPEEREVL
jgi:antitoxin VapB